MDRCIDWRAGTAKHRCPLFRPALGFFTLAARDNAADIFVFVLVFFEQGVVFLVVLDFDLKIVDFAKFVVCGLLAVKARLALRLGAFLVFVGGVERHFGRRFDRRLGGFNRFILAARLARFQKRFGNEGVLALRAMCGRFVEVVKTRGAVGAIALDPEFGLVHVWFVLEQGERVRGLLPRRTGAVKTRREADFGSR